MENCDSFNMETLSNAQVFLFPQQFSFWNGLLATAVAAETAEKFD